MPVAADHFFCLMPHPFIYHALVNARCGTVRGETVPQYVPASQDSPNTNFQGAPEMIMGLIACHRDRLWSVSFAADKRGLAEQTLPAWVDRQPLS